MPLLAIGVVGFFVTGAILLLYPQFFARRYRWPEPGNVPGYPRRGYVTHPVGIRLLGAFMCVSAVVIAYVALAGS